MKVAVVTGGGRGLGRAFAQALAAAGYAVAVLARTEAELAETVALIERSGGKASAFPADVVDGMAIDRAFTEVERTLGRVDLLVNNAGVVGPLGPFAESDARAWWRTLEVNLHGQMLCAHRALPGMIARRRGRIVNIASGGGATMLPYFSAYVTSKTAALIEDVRNHDSQVRSSSDRPPSWSLLPSARPMSCRDATCIPRTISTG